MAAANAFRSLQIALYRPFRNAFIAVSRVVRIAILSCQDGAHDSLTMIAPLCQLFFNWQLIKDGDSQ
jgi:hypothetical protein